MATIKKIKVSTPMIKPKKKVAAYARVSMETEMLHHSLSAQVSYYSKLIQNNPEWQYAGVYADYGITGTSTNRRDEFNRMLADCKAGNIDLVLVKSISRFARDTIDCLNVTRYLKSIGVEVYFEREKISSFTADGELMLTLLASFAQEESRSISENVKWGIRKRFEQGIQAGVKAPFGYRWNGEMYRIIPEEGEIVKSIYRRYLSGESAYSIAKDVPVDESTVKFILTNPSYTGTQVLQKNFITENHKRRKNKGELPMYAVEGMYEPLVSEEDFQRAGEIMTERAEASPNRDPVLTAFSGKVKCGCCGFGVSRRTRGGVKVWVCNTKERKGKDVCNLRTVKESEMEAAATMALALDAYDPEIVKRQINGIVIHDDCIEFFFENGRSKKVDRVYSGKRGSNGFTNKVYCGICGCKCERDNWSLGKKVWICSGYRKTCTGKKIFEGELHKAAELFLGPKFQAEVIKSIDRIFLHDDKVEFVYKDGESKTWQRE